MKTRTQAVLLFLLCAAAISVGVWRLGYVAALEQLSRRGEADLALAADGLKGQLQRYSDLAVFLADHPTLRPILQGQPTTVTASDLLIDAADKSGALDILVINSAGQELLNARGATYQPHAAQPYFERAMDGALGTYHLLSDRYDGRAFYFSAPVFSEQGPAAGTIVVAADAEGVEAAWRGDRPTLFFTDDLGVVFLTNRTELLFRRQGDAVAVRGRSASYPPDRLLPFIDVTPKVISGIDIWNVNAGRYLPTSAVHIALPLPVINMRGEVLIDVAPAQRLALLQAMLAFGLCLTFGALLFLATERRRRLAVINAKLEQRVARRTAELVGLNNDLRREVETRRDAEARLTHTQAELVQAGKLSALGQMSAGISHELNQPLMAIRSFAENAQTFIARDKTDVVAKNLERISELSQRMGRIIQNLRAFARHEDAPLGDVDIVAAIEAVIEISGPKARGAGVTLHWTPPSQPVLVRAGNVRLQQVLINLVGNAIDAMAQRPVKRVTLTVDMSDRVRVTVRDTGPGIQEPEKIFEPFYSTKTVGSEDGMGLGLSISYGLVQSFGGDIRGRNCADGGAEFTVELDPAAQRAIA